MQLFLVLIFSLLGLLIRSICTSHLLINFAGCILLGVLYATKINKSIVYILSIGLCSSLTTYSAFFIDSLNYLVSAQIMKFIFYLLSYCLVCLFGMILGYRLSLKFLN